MLSLPRALLLQCDNKALGREPFFLARMLAKVSDWKKEHRMRCVTVVIADQHPIVRASSGSCCVSHLYDDTMRGATVEGVADRVRIGEHCWMTNTLGEAPLHRNLRP